MSIHRQILSGGQYLGFAETHFRNLERLRKQAGVGVLQKSIFVGDFQIYLYTSDWTNLIRISGGGASGNMLFCKRDGDFALVYVYDYLTQKLASLGKVPVASGPLSFLPIYGTKSHLVSVESHGYKNVKPTGLDVTFEDGNDYILVAYRTDYVNGLEYAVALTTEGPKLFARTSATPFRLAATFPKRVGPHGEVFTWALENGDDPRAFQISGEIVYLGGYWEDSGTARLWNMFNGYEFFGYDPTGATAPVKQWFSEAWFLEPGEFNTVPGIKWGNTYGPLDNVIIEFGSLLDDRSGKNNSGRCELYVYGTIIEDFRLPDAISPTLVMAYRDKTNENTGFPHFLNLNEYLAKNDTYTTHYWAYDKGLGFVVSDSLGGWVVKVGSNIFTSGTGYVFHTLSTDGKLLCIVDVTGGTIIDVEKQTVALHPKLISFESGCFIPPAGEAKDPISLAVNAVDIDTITEDPAMGEVRPGASLNSTENNSNWKITCSGGFFVGAHLWKDECWRWSATAVHGHGTVEIEGTVYPISSAPYIAGSTKDGETLLGRWAPDRETEFTLASILVKAVSGIDYIKKFEAPNPTLWATPIGSPKGTHLLENYSSGEVEWTASGGAYVVDPDNQDVDASGAYGLPVCGKGTITVTATDRCQRVGKAEWDVSALEVSGDTNITDTSAYGAINGKAPYTFSISSGTINTDTGQVISLTGACGTGSIQVTDDCGDSATMQVMFPSGQWVTLSSSTCGGIPGGTTTCWEYSYNGATRTGQWWVEGRGAWPIPHIGCPGFSYGPSDGAEQDIYSPCGLYPRYWIAIYETRIEEWQCL